MEKLKWACIGIGKHTELRGGVNAIAYAHAEALKRNADEFELVAGASLEQENLDAFAREFPSRGYLDINELLAKERLDGCTISTWAPAREEHVTAAIKAGVKNILIEKPLALTMDAADRMKTAADAAGARLFVNFQRRYGRPFELAKEVVESGRLGAIVSVDLAQPCSNALDFGPHFVNAAQFILGNPAPKAVFAGAEGLGTVPWHGMKVEARMMAAVFLENGVRLDYTAMPENSWDAPVIRVNGTKGFCELWTNKPEEAKSVFRLVTAEGEENPALDENFHHGDEDRFLYFQRRYADIARAIRTGAPSRVDFDGGYATQKILLAMYESAEKGRLVEASQSMRKLIIYMRQ